jgi:hypothetical protein
MLIKIYTMASSGIRLGAWDYIRWKHIQPIKRDVYEMGVESEPEIHDRIIQHPRLLW